MKSLRSVLAACLAMPLLSGTSPASDTSISSIRLAAMQRLQEKLGPLRGSISPEAENILLTNRMIDLLRPIDSKERRAKFGDAVIITAPADDTTTGSLLPPIDSGENAETIVESGPAFDEIPNDELPAASPPPVNEMDDIIAFVERAINGGNR